MIKHVLKDCLTEMFGLYATTNVSSPKSQPPPRPLIPCSTELAMRTLHFVSKYLHKITVKRILWPIKMEIFYSMGATTDRGRWIELEFLVMAMLAWHVCCSVQTKPFRKTSFGEMLQKYVKLMFTNFGIILLYVGIATYIDSISHYDVQPTWWGFVLALPSTFARERHGWLK